MFGQIVQEPGKTTGCRVMCFKHKRFHLVSNFFFRQAIAMLVFSKKKNVQEIYVPAWSKNNETLLSDIYGGREFVAKVATPNIINFEPVQVNVNS